MTASLLPQGSSTSAATLIVTHGNPDLDAIAFIYSARKAYGSTVPIECRSPTCDELGDPTVIVGDVGLPGCEDIGYNPTLNNFHHHYSSAEQSATLLFNGTYHSLNDDIVKYVDTVDTQGLRETTEFTLKVAVVGIRVRYKGDDLRILMSGGDLLQWIEQTEQDPRNLQPPIPPAVQSILQGGQTEMREIERELEGMEPTQTASGRSVGYVATRSPVFSVVKEEMFSRRVDIAVVHDPAKRRFSIACDLQHMKEGSLKRSPLIQALYNAECAQGLSRDQAWGGHRDRIGSPRPNGSLLSREEVLQQVMAHL